jgi:hypothetical protein
MYFCIKTLPGFGGIFFFFVLCFRPELCHYWATAVRRCGSGGGGDGTLW